MNNFVFDKSTLQIVGKVYPHFPFEKELELNVFPNYGGIESDYAIIDTDIDLPILVVKDGEIIATERTPQKPEPQPPSQTDVLAEELVKMKFENMQKDNVISTLGEEITKLKLELMILKGGT